MATPLEMFAAKNWTVGQLAALIYKLGEKTAEAIMDDTVRVRTEPAFFSTPQEQIDTWKKVMLGDGAPSEARSLFMNCNFPVPAWPASETAAPVLTLVGCSADAELRLYWDILNKNTRIQWEWDAFPIEHNQVGWWKDSKNHNGLWRLEWQIVDFWALNEGRRGPGVKGIRKASPNNCSRFPSAAVLATLLVHPRFVRMISEGKAPNMDIAGYTLGPTGEIDPLYTHVVSVDREGNNRVKIKSTRDVPDYNFSIPMFYTGNTKQPA